MLEDLQPVVLIVRKPEHCLACRSRGVENTPAVCNSRFALAASRPLRLNSATTFRVSFDKGKKPVGVRLHLDTAVLTPVEARNGFQDRRRLRPCAAVLSPCIEANFRIMIEGEGQAQIAVEHHDLSILRLEVLVADDPLILVLVAVESNVRHPAVRQHRYEEVVVELAAVYGVAPPTIVARVLQPCSSQGVHSHERGRLFPREA
mmetsp:Transcript_38411/g.84237  ORF Transcript_38411/g.84237 Transcript_38411/m.84237 type:complete len:204 (-) Transcript_38411:373-984(-)